MFYKWPKKEKIQGHIDLSRFRIFLLNVFSFCAKQKSIWPKARSLKPFFHVRIHLLDLKGLDCIKIGKEIINKTHAAVRFYSIVASFDE